MTSSNVRELIERAAYVIANETDATEAERVEASILMAKATFKVMRKIGLLPDPPSAPSLLEFSYQQVIKLTAQGNACGWLAEQLPRWASDPDMTLADMLKTERPERVAHIVEEMHKVGLKDLDGLVINSSDLFLEDDSGSY